MWHPQWDSRMEKGHSEKDQRNLNKAWALVNNSQYWLKLWQMYHNNKTIIVKQGLVWELSVLSWPFFGGSKAILTFCKSGTILKFFNFKAKCKTHSVKENNTLGNNINKRYIQNPMVVYKERE